MFLSIAAITLVALFSSICCNPDHYLHHNLYAHPLAQNIKRYCALKHRANFRYCMLENHAADLGELYRNCAQQVKLYPTLHQLDEFICKTRSEKEYLKFLSCYIPAISTLYKDDLKEKITAENCLKIEENREKKKHLLLQKPVLHNPHQQHNLYHRVKHQQPEILLHHLLLK